MPSPATLVLLLRARSAPAAIPAAAKGPPVREQVGGRHVDQDQARAGHGPAAVQDRHGERNVRAPPFLSLLCFWFLLPPVSLSFSPFLPLLHTCAVPGRLCTALGFGAALPGGVARARGDTERARFAPPTPSQVRRLQGNGPGGGDGGRRVAEPDQRQPAAQDVPQRADGHTHAPVVQGAWVGSGGRDGGQPND